jgi:hypothetical protein
MVVNRVCNWTRPSAPRLCQRDRNIDGKHCETLPERADCEIAEELWLYPSQGVFKKVIPDFELYYNQIPDAEIGSSSSHLTLQGTWLAILSTPMAQVQVMTQTHHHGQSCNSYCSSASELCREATPKAMRYVR